MSLGPQKGRTAAGRLDGPDVFVSRHRQAPVGRALDVGLGTSPDTTVAFARALRARWPEVAVVGLDNVPARVDAARGLAPGVQFVCEDLFAAPTGTGFDVVRAINVLRSFPPATARAGRAQLWARLRPRGWLLEGSTDKGGDCGALYIVPKDAPARESRLLLFCDERRGFAPRMFRGVLPQDLARGGPIPWLAGWFADWQQAFDDGADADARGFGPTGARLIDRRGDTRAVDLRPWGGGLAVAVPEGAPPIDGVR